MDEELLISLVCLRPAIWDKTSCDHHNRYVLEKLWNEIADFLGLERDSEYIEYIYSIYYFRGITNDKLLFINGFIYL